MMNAACDACRGACCATLVLPLPIDGDAAVWITLRGKREGDMVRINAPCNELVNGLCAIHETKPHICKIFAVGSPACIAAIRAQRPRQAAELIELARRHQG
jgi:hypothetical protein